MRNLLAAMVLAQQFGFSGQSGPTPAWQDPAYGRWHSSVIGGGGYLLNTVACPSDPNRMYLYGDMDGLFRSDDGGNRWRIIHANLPVQQGHYEFAGLAVDRQNADRIAAAAGDQDGPKDGVFLSDDGGKSWTKTLSVRFMGNGPFRWAGTLLDGSRRQGGVFRTDDFGW